MIRDAVLDARGESPLEQSSPVHQEDVVADVDVVQALLEAVHRSGHPLELSPGASVRRPFDAQYWACWVAATVAPVLMTFLWITR
jgi:hypothetical protein